MASYENVVSRGKKRVKAKVRIRGHRPVTRVFDRKTDAKRWADQTETDIRNGQHFKSRSTEKKTVADMIDRYLKDELPKLNQKDSCKIHRLKWWHSEIGFMRLNQISRSDIKDCQEKLLSEALPNGECRKPSTVNRYMAALSHVYSYAVKEWEWVDESPMGKVRKLKESKGRQRVFSDDEVRLLLDACKASELPFLYPIAVLALATGARQGEIRKLKWSDVSFSTGTVKFLDTKNSDNREVPLSNGALEALREHGKVRPLGTDYYVFSSKRHGKAPVGRTALYRHWKVALESAGITDEEAVFHITRHTALTNMVRSGMDLVQVASIAGHKSIQTTMIYAHAQLDEKRAGLEKMNAGLFG